MAGPGRLGGSAARTDVVRSRPRPSKTGPRGDPAVGVWWRVVAVLAVLGCGSRGAEVSVLEEAQVLAEQMKKLSSQELGVFTMQVTWGSTPGDPHLEVLTWGSNSLHTFILSTCFIGRLLGTKNLNRNPR